MYLVASVRRQLLCTDGSESAEELGAVTNDITAEIPNTKKAPVLISASVFLYSKFSCVV